MKFGIYASNYIGIDTYYDVLGECHCSCPPRRPYWREEGAAPGPPYDVMSLQTFILGLTTQFAYKKTRQLAVKGASREIIIKVEILAAILDLTVSKGLK